MQPSSRPFESLDWYRDASRRQYRRGGPVGQSIRWLRSARAFAFHVGLLALGCTIAMAWNVARQPDEIWVDRMALAWTLVLVIHAAVAILIAFVGLLGSSEPELPAYRPQFAAAGAPPAAEQPRTGTTPPASPASTWGPPPTDRQPSAPETGTPPPPPAATATRGWSQWSQPRQPGGWGTRRDAGETASWSETAPGAVIRRRRGAQTTTIAPEPTTEPPADA